MKVLVVLSAVLASCLASPSIGYAYSAISPLTGYSSIADPYAYGAPIISDALFAAPYAEPIVPIAPVAAPLKTQHHSQDELGQAKYGHTEPLQAHEATQDAYGNKMGSFSYVDPHGAVHETHYVADAAGYRVSSNDLPLGPAPLPLLHRKRRQAWTGPQASPVVTQTGHLAETPEVAAARAAHLTEHARQHTGVQSQPQQSWNQQPPSASWNQPQAASSSWTQPRAASSWSQAPAASWSQPQAATPSWNQASSAAPSWQAQSSSSWTQPQADARSWNQGPATFQNAASVTITPSGNLADTPEVAAAKAAHFSEFQRAASAAEPSSSDDGSYRPEHASASPTWSQAPAAPTATGYSSWNQPQASQSWDQPQASQSWNQPQATQSWSQPQAARSWSQPQTSSWQQPQAASWQQQPSWDQSPSGGIPDTPEVAAAKAAHLAEHAAASRRTKRSLFYQTPASTSPLATPLITPLPYAAPAISYAAPAIPYAAPAIHYGAPGIPAIHTDIVHNPGHAISYRVDPAPLLL